MASLDNQSNDGRAGALGDPVLPLPRKVLMSVSKALGKHWKNLGRQMEISDATIESIKTDYGTDGIEEVAYQLLRTWQEKMGNDATASALIHNLKEIDRRDIADMLQSTLQIDVNPIEISSADVHHGGEALYSCYDLQNEVKQRLKNEYQTVRMNGLPWMEDLQLSIEKYYVNLPLKKIDDKGLQLSSQPTDLEEIFTASEEKEKPSRILIEGGPGMGKTTLAAKLAYDWATDTVYITNFDLVFFIPLRFFKGTLEETLCKAAKVKEKHHKYMLELLKDKSKRILLLLDGYDEISSETASKIQPLLRREIYSHTTVVMTSRPGNIETNDSESRETSFFSHADVTTNCNFFQKRLSVNGFNASQQQTFVTMHVRSLSEHKQQILATKLGQIADKEFLKCPLFLLLLLVVFTDNIDIEPLTITKTYLYKQVFNCVIRRYFYKQNDPAVSKIDLFSIEAGIAANLRPPYLSLMMQFSKFCIWALGTNKLYFSEEEIVQTCCCSSEILKLGFLTQSVLVTGLREKLLYEPVHRSLLEFGASYCVWIAYVEHQNWQKDIISIAPHKILSSLTLPFFVGLIGNLPQDLLTLLNPYSAFYRLKLGLLFDCLKEVQSTPSDFTSFSPFLPFTWIKQMTTDCNEVHGVSDEILVWGLKEGITKQFLWNIPMKISIPYEVVIDTLLVKFNDKAYHASSMFEDTHNRMQCRHMCCEFAPHFSSENLVKSINYLLNKVDFQQLSFVFFTNMLHNVHKIMTLRALANETIHSIQIGLNSEELQHIELIKTLAATTKLERLEIFVNELPQTHKKLLEDLFHAVAVSTRLKCFAFVNNSNVSPFKVDLAKLFSEGRESWNWVQLVGIKLNCRQEVKKQISINCLDLPPTDVSERATKLLRHLAIKSLSCCASLVGHCRFSSSFHESLTELNVVLDATIQNGVATLLDQIRSLQVLTLTMTAQYSLSISFESWFLGSQSLRCLRGIEIWCAAHNPVLAQFCVKGIAHCLKEECCDSGELQTHELVPLQSHKGKKLKLQYLMVNNSVSRSITVPVLSPFEEQTFLGIVSELKSSLVETDLQRIEIVPMTNIAVQQTTTAHCLTLLDIFPVEEGFAVRDDSWGTNETDSIYSKMTNEQSPELYPRFNITFKEIVNAKQCY